VEHALEPNPDGLSERHRLAVAIADAVMTRPGDLDDETVRQVRDRFSPEQIIEIVLKVLKFNTQKVKVALGTHTWLTPEQIASVRWNTEATYVAAD
jgi:alkylhydroperoxidase family enzyme